MSFSRWKTILTACGNPNTVKPVSYTHLDVYKRQGFQRNNINVAEYIKNGLLDSETFAAKSEPKDVFELVRKEDIDDLMAAFPVKRLHYVAADGCALFMREAIDSMDRETFELYLKYHFATCERGDLSGITSHAIDIFEK